MINMRCLFLISALLLNVCWCYQYSGYPWFGNYYSQYYPGIQMAFPGFQMGFPGFGNYYNQYYPGIQMGYPGFQMSSLGYGNYNNQYYPGMQNGYPGMQNGYLGMQTGYPGYQMGYPGYGIGSGLGLLNQFKDEETIPNPFHITGFSEGDESSTGSATGSNNFYSVSHSSVSTVDKDGKVHKTGETVINKNGEITKFKD